MVIKAENRVIPALTEKYVIKYLSAYIPPPLTFLVSGGGHSQKNFFHKPAFEENTKLMDVIDSINKAHG